MQQIIFGVLFFISTVIANDGLNSIYENIILKNSKKTLIDIKNLKNHIKQNQFKMAQEEFKNLVISWKSVQGFYILGDLDDNYLDTPRYLDIFHEGNEDIKKQLDLILSTNEELKIAHFKNSQKTINALEYILFTKDLKIQRIKDIAIRIINKMEQNFLDIYDGYIENKSKFLKDEVTSNAIMLNALIENSYKLKEWRVGDTAGLSRKYKNKPDNSRAEYAISKNSIIAIQSIINTHLQILSKQQFINFGDMIKSYGVNNELSDSIKYLNSALIHSNDIKNGDFSNSKDLYKSLKKLHMTYYISLIGKLKITAKILDADGD